MVQVRLLGEVSASTDRGQAVDIGPAKCRTVLAALALSVGSPVPVSRLVELVWGTAPPRTADKTLQSYVTRLRKGLGPDSIVRAGLAYRLEIDPQSVDVVRFQQRLDAGDIEAALAEWSGTPLAGLDAEGLTAAAGRLVEQWLGALEIDLGRRLEIDPAEVIGTLTELTATYPFREGLWALFMTALYRVGRQADALAAYRQARQHLIEELGVEPGPRLRELESSILGQDEGLQGEPVARGSSAGLPTGTVTFAFSGIENSSRLWAEHRSRMADAVARHDELIQDAAAAHGGYVFSTGGDSFGLAFHGTTAALEWAETIQSRFDDEPWPADLALRVRIGLHSGEAEERRNNYFGPAVNTASTIAAAGHGGQILVSAPTEALLDRPDLIDLGVFRLDGVVGDRRVFQLGDAEHPPLRTDHSIRGNLPHGLGRLIGREDELGVIGDGLQTAPLVTLVGSGGIGKTRLALAAAHLIEGDLTGGAWLVELAGVTSSADVPRAVADVLGLKETGTRTLTESIVLMLASRQMLLLLDNCEHVVDGAAMLAQALAEGCADVRTLATSREGFGLSSELLVSVSPLRPEGSGSELFNERALAADRTFDPNANRTEVEEICRRLDGVPLAIELAAARTRSLSPADLIERLDDRLRLLTGGRRRSVERHRTLRATIQWSYDLLLPPERTLFQQLSVFGGSFDLPAAESIAADPDLDGLDVDNLLSNLVDRSMLIVESGPFGRRFRLLETMRQFGAELLLESGTTDLIAGRHSRWCLAEVEQIHRLLSGKAESEGVARLNELWANLRAAIEWACDTGDPHLAMGLLQPVAAELLLRSQTGEIGDWAERILAASPPEDSELIVFGLFWAARRYQPNLDRQAYEELLKRYGEPDHPLLRYARTFLYDDYGEVGDSAPAAVDHLRQTGQVYLADLFELIGVGGGLLSSGQLDEHGDFMTGFIEQHQGAGPPTFLHWALAMLGYSAAVWGDDDEADRFFERSAGIEVPDRTHSMNKPIAARAAFRQGDQARAFQILRSRIDELSEQNRVTDVGVICIEFINMMVAVDQILYAATALRYLEMSNLTRSPFSILIEDSARSIASKVDEDVKLDIPFNADLDDLWILGYMGDALYKLATD